MKNSNKGFVCEEPCEKVEGLMPMDCSIQRRKKKDEQLKLLLENDSDHLKEAIHSHAHPHIGLNVNELNECLNDGDDSSKKVVTNIICQNDKSGMIRIYIH